MIDTRELRHFHNLLDGACVAPAVYVGRDDFELLGHFLQGYSAGHQRGSTGRGGQHLNCRFLGEEWHEHLYERRGWARSVCWISHIQRESEESGGVSPFDILRKEFQAFYEKLQHSLILLAECAEEPID